VPPTALPAERRSSCDDSGSEESGSDGGGGSGGGSGGCDGARGGESLAAPSEQQRQLEATSWTSGKLAYAAVQDYVLFTRKQCKVDKKQKGGKYKVVICSCDGCPFNLRINKRKDKTWGISKNSAWDHVNCTSHAKPTALQLGKFAPVRSAVGQDPSVPAKQIGAIVQVSRWWKESLIFYLPFF
jgi:hypothetical protein